jgi:uncharacterized membrane protein YqjE
MEPTMAVKDSARPLASTVMDVVSDIAHLVQTEVRLARAEVGEKLAGAANGGMLVGAAAALSLAGLIVLLLAAVKWLEIAGLSQEWGLLLVGGVAVIIGVALALVGANRFRASALTPDRTISQVGADISVVKEHAT